MLWQGCNHSELPKPLLREGNTGTLFNTSEIFRFLSRELSFQNLLLLL